ncbi:hypothetical protein FE257_005745 [Aspergillus nanangensis]|uniref:Zn(2)-C6 fungal-type domain-containing protein n=1 Tax=Aspergillus nanangensis TaxID=2582783 RepID=A0AAD4CQ14_ASPNN|nr:hypothetical protein FE257_005745 [Aspergillus nanangensis]
MPMQSSHRDSRIKKRSSNACQRCRRQKIKCSGSQPCDTCSKRKLTCNFDDRDQKVLVTRGYIEDLHRKISSLERAEEGVFSPQSVEHDVNRPNEGDIIATAEDAEWNQNIDGATNLTNPLSTGPSMFMAAPSGRTFYLGTSSNWSFARKILSMTHEHLYNSALPTSDLLFDSSAYDLTWDGMRTTVDSNIPTAPPLDFSIYLINAVKFHAGQLFHLFDEQTFMEGLYAFYDNPKEHMATCGLWYIHYLLILAFGKAFVVQRNQANRPPGCDLFIKALQLLPDTTHLSRDPIIATEILCCIALYLQSLDFRNPAHNFIGQAMRIALAQGMHTDMPVEHLGDPLVQRCRKIWWTVYILDRQMTCLMGLPHSIRDDQLHHQLPSFPGNPQRAIALSLQIKMCQIMEETNSTVYGPDGRLNRRFLVKTKSALANTASLANELQSSYDLRLDEAAVSGVSRLSAHLHLLYHQCMVLATRPVLFCFLKLRFQSPDNTIESLNSSANVCKLLQVCIDSARQMLNILTVLQGQNLLDSFLPFDLDSTFISAVVLVAAPATHCSLLDDASPWLHKSYTILDEMILRGNIIAGFRKAELEQLANMLTQLFSSQPAVANEPVQQTGIVSRLPSPILPDHGQNTFGVPELPDLNDVLTTAEIMAVAESIDTGDVDWIAQAVTENHIW